MDVVEALETHGSQLSERPQGYLLLHLAAAIGSTPAISHLIANRANVNGVHPHPATRWVDAKLDPTGSRAATASRYLNVDVMRRQSTVTAASPLSTAPPLRGGCGRQSCF